MKDGGPAFPVIFEHDEGRCVSEQEGMSLRDYFAAHAPLHGLKFDSASSAAEFVGEKIPTTTDELIAVEMKCAAKTAYIYADAMLEARKK